MNRAALGDLKQAPALFLAQRALQLNEAIDLVDLSLLCFAGHAIDRINLVMLEANGNVFQGPVLDPRITAKRTTARYGPTFVSRIRRPVNVVPKIPSCTKSSFSASLPRACSVAIFAQ